jgi:hypothetical protein
VSEPVDDRPPSERPDPWPGAYRAVASAAGVVFLLIAAISLLIALRQWILPSSPEDFGGGVFGPGIEGENAPIRSLLGALAFALTGALVLWWHRRGAVPTTSAGTGGVAWSRSLFLHLVAVVSLLVAMGGATVTLTSLRDAVVRQCFPSFYEEGPLAPAPSEVGSFPDDIVTPPPPISDVPPVEIPIDPGFAPQPECYPERGDALRGALDAGLVGGVAGATWAWTLRRGRRGATHPSAEG